MLSESVKRTCLSNIRGENFGRMVNDGSAQTSPAFPAGADDREM